MRIGISLVAAFTIVPVIGLSTAQAVVVFQDNFDSYSAQGDLDAVWPVLAGTAAGVSYESVRLSQEQSVSTPNSAKAPAQPTGATLLQRSAHTFPAQSFVSIGDKIVYSFDFYDSNGASAPYREYGEIRSPSFGSGTNQLIAMGLNNNQTSSDSGGQYYMGRILGYIPNSTDPDGGPGDTANGGAITGAGQFFKLNDFGVGTRSTGWHNLKVEISIDDLTNTDYKFYVDNTLAEIINNVGSSASIRSYEQAVLGSALTNGSNAAYFDNVKVEYIAAAGPVPGDYNGNGTVDAADYVLWRKGGPLQNEVDAPGTVNDQDYIEWRLRFGNISGSGSGSGLSAAGVPEPASIGIVLIGLSICGIGRRRRAA
jgi:hypothetical protein